MKFVSSRCVVSDEVRAGTRQIIEVHTDELGVAIRHGYFAHPTFDHETVLNARVLWLGAEMDRIKVWAAARADAENRLSALLADAIAAGSMSSDEYREHHSVKTREAAAFAELNQRWRKRLWCHHWLLLAKLASDHSIPDVDIRTPFERDVLVAMTSVRGRALTPDECSGLVVTDWIRESAEFFDEIHADTPNWWVLPRDRAAALKTA